MFTLDTCDAIIGAEVFTFDKQVDLLVRWRNFVVEVDPDLIIGYNFLNFDLPYLLDRARLRKAAVFPYLGRLKRM